MLDVRRLSTKPSRKVVELAVWALKLLRRLLSFAMLAGSALAIAIPFAAIRQPSACAQPDPKKPDCQPQATVDWHIKKLAAEAPLALRFRGTTADECERWQKQFADKLRDLLGPHAPPKKWRLEVRQVKEFDDHRREELVLHAEGRAPLPIYILVPHDKVKGKRPGIVALHGHGEYGHHPVAGRDDLPGVAKAIEASNYDYGRQLARRGYVVAVPCLTPFGQRLGQADGPGKQDACAVTFIRLQLLGKLLIAENLRDCLWAVEALAKRDEVDAE